MHAISTITLLASLAVGILAQEDIVVGGLETFTDAECSAGVHEIEISESNFHGKLDADVVSVQADLDLDCGLLFFKSKGDVEPAYVIPGGDDDCHKLPESEDGLLWYTTCDEDFE